ncbi:hypothetical protein HanIR_Chr02g0095171 [Helianthus annuus]|nr:hypothetical protein HanIR_Chr02g0095171 [Helianthus annuus]
MLGFKFQTKAKRHNMKTKPITDQANRLHLKLADLLWFSRFKRLYKTQCLVIDFLGCFYL